MNVTDLIIYAISKFPKYDVIKYNFNFDYNKTPKNEIWKDIPNFNYECSNYGRIRNITTKKLKQLRISRYGNQVMLWKDSKGYLLTISRLVGSLFIREVNKDERVSHIDGNIRNNYYKNLRITSKNTI
ncbi:MAG: NUMOD4 domain-containing protein [Clostridia bacterium]|jgi:hypothetical protein